MTKNAIRQARDAQKLKPFNIRLSDGRSIAVPHPDYLFIPPDDTENVVMVTQPGGGFDLIDPTQITSIESKTARKKAA